MSKGDRRAIFGTVYKAMRNGVQPVAVLDTPVVRRMGLKANALERWLLRHPRTKHLVRGAFGLRSVWSLRDGAKRADSRLWQAGRSVATIRAIEPAGGIVRTWTQAAREA